MGRARLASRRDPLRRRLAGGVLSRADACEPPSGQSAGLVSVRRRLYREDRDAAFQGIAASSVDLAPFFDFSTKFGTSGNDTLNGAYNGTIFYGLEGDDRLYGGSGGDSYQFARGHGNDVILDYNGFDQIVFGSGITAVTLGLGFCMIWFFERRHWWFLIPGGIILLVRLTSMRRIGALWPLVLIDLGGYLLYDQSRRRPR